MSRERERWRVVGCWVVGAKKFFKKKQKNVLTNVSKAFLYRLIKFKQSNKKTRI